MAEKQSFRHELKYLINLGDKELLRYRIKDYMDLDKNAKNGSYKIRSIYFDDYWNRAYTDKLSGVQHRKKYRIRFYDDSDKVIRLECKIKNASFINKIDTPLNREQTEALLNGSFDFLLKREERLCHEFYYQCVSRVLRPKCIVDYEREPYIFEDGDVRVTFDNDVRATALLTKDVFNPDLPSIYVLEPGKLILEVKFTEFLPKLIKQLLPAQPTEYQAFSKYTYCCERTASFNTELRSNMY
ncbi:MAG: polyphosphate polymerase domain-containing protein [Eubacteriales bacterium]|nr:polyphosphate polymerase domain-containing protein [Eubacteriales bacterium]MDD4476051.1 polyphosphate polymerase domain-containing protein [Eubacteriales bacterium]